MRIPTHKLKVMTKQNIINEYNHVLNNSTPNAKIQKIIDRAERWIDSYNPGFAPTIYDTKKDVVKALKKLIKPDGE